MKSQLPLPGFLDEPAYFDSLETWEQFLVEVEAMPDSVQKLQTILHAEHMIALKTEELVPTPSNLPFMVAMIDEPGPFGNNLSELAAVSGRNGAIARLGPKAPNRQ